MPSAAGWNNLIGSRSDVLCFPSPGTRQLVAGRWAQAEERQTINFHK